ncbi:hypothetical protein A2690_04875 [Candidatus Roizmanbacteria bacterium RIFCSPHIGHO2_01_FULL_39_12b]|uniref:SurA N-terminal domain-containing protein n=1 Tax=Candidatus Roizmanbacteria bacterium RIFCSPHIGHO2_01_FULL_39_12b TaxID=1802030 RepID=A0A1F7GD18_9BACT|nr:MAG: hypothetical protein A2690_04875 [Candidatus Roizmanbacteria bacterium RIFCSPHIGHO2_01_FULL_39_12b]
MPRKKTVIDEEASPASPATPRKNLKPLIVGIIIVTAAILIVKNYLLAATVNGQPITRFAVISELEKQSGKQTLESLVTETLILQEGKKRKITITQGEISDQIKDIEKSLVATGQNLNDALKSQGLTKEKLEKQIKLQKILEKIVGDKVNVTEKEIDTFVKNNKDSIPAKSDMKKIRGQIRGELKRDKMSSKIQKWVSDAQKKAKIIYFYKYL